MRHLIVVLTISSLFAQNHPDLTQIASQGFLWLDIHPRDGFLERNELTDIFTDQDKDGNGKLTYAEFAAEDINNLMRQQLFNYLDINKDGFLTKVELVDNTYNAMDVNSDNQVTKNEFAHFYLNSA